MSSIDQAWESDWGLFTKVCQDTIDLLVKGTAHTRMKAIGGKTTVKASATSDKKRLNRIAMYLERLRTRALRSLEGFLMYAHYGHVDAIPT